MRGSAVDVVERRSPKRGRLPEARALVVELRVSRTDSSWSASMLATLVALELLVKAPVALDVPPPVETAVVELGRYRDGGRERVVHGWPMTPAIDGWRLVEIEEPEHGRRVRAAIGREAIVRLAPSTDVSALVARHPALSVRPLFEAARLHAVSSTTHDGLALAVLLADDPLVDEIVPDLALARRPAQIEVPPDDPLYGGQWFYEKLGMDDVWATQAGSPDVTIVVIDNGCDGTHEDLIDKLDTGRDVLEDDDDVTPPVVNGAQNNHGTACAGLVGASTDNGVGVAGMCPACRVRCVRLVPDDGAFVPIADDVEAFAWSNEIGAAVISNSWGFNGNVTVPGPLRTAIEAAAEYGRDGKGAVVVFAAGNEARIIEDDELCAVFGVLCVGAITTFDETTSFSNKGKPIDIVAYAGTYTTDIMGPLGDDEGNYTALFGGTSSACPVAAGAAALLVAERPDLTALEVIDAIVQSARPAIYATPDEDGHDLEYGYGILDVGAALAAVRPDAADAGGRDDAGEPEPDAGDDEPIDDGCGGCASGDASLASALALTAMVLRRRRGEASRPRHVPAR